MAAAVAPGLQERQINKGPQFSQPRPARTRRDARKPKPEASAGLTRDDQAEVKNSKADSSSQSDAQNLKFERADWTSFRTVEGLQQKAGVAQDKLIRLVLKELTDNGLDTGAEVTVGEMTAASSSRTKAPASTRTIPNLFSIARPLTSTKMLRLPTRGALGNGLRVAAGAVLASGGTLAVISRGVRLELKPQRDGTTAVVKRSASDRLATRIEISFGAVLPHDPHALIWANLAIWLAKGGSSYSGSRRPTGTTRRSSMSFCRPASGPACGRWWRNSTAALAVGRARLSPPPVLPARPAMRSMRLGPLGCCERPAPWPSRSTRSGSARSGRKPFRATPTPSPMARRFGASPLEAVIPFAVEAWAAKAEAPDDSAASVSVNRTPIAAEFLMQRDKTELNLFGCGLRHTVAKTPLGSEVTLWLNLMTPYMPITSDGKEPNLEPFLAGIIEAAGKAVRKRRGGSASGATQKDVVFDHLAEVIDIVSGPERYRFNDRQLFYRLRPIIVAETGKELKLSNWKSILDAYEGENGEIELMYREPRGSLTHPHRNETFALGTLMVEQYVRPAWTFNKLLYIEKEGAQEALKQDRWLERHDCAVMSSKGFSTRAARDLIDKLVEHDEPIESLLRP